METKSKKIREPVQQRSIDKKEKIIQTAYRLISDTGYDSISVRMIAREANVPVGTIYFYFKDKRAVYLEVLNIYQQDLSSALSKAAMAAIKTESDLEEIFYRFIIGIRDFIREHQSFHKALWVLSITDEWFRKPNLSMEKKSVTQLFELFNDMLDKSQITIPNMEVMSYLIHRMIEEIVQHLLFFKIEIEQEKVIREMAVMICAYLERYKTD